MTQNWTRHYCALNRRYYRCSTHVFDCSHRLRVAVKFHVTCNLTSCSHIPVCQIQVYHFPVRQIGLPVRKIPVRQFPVRHFPVRQIPPLLVRPSFSSLATPPPTLFVKFQSCIFQSCKFSYSEIPFLRITNWKLDSAPRLEKNLGFYEKSFKVFLGFNVRRPDTKL